MVMQAVQFGNPGEAALHTQVNDRASVSTGEATRGGLLGSRNKNAFGAPAQLDSGAGRKRGKSPLQSSSLAVQV